MRGRRKGNASLKSLQSERMVIGIAPVDTTMFDTFVLYLSRKCDTIFKLGSARLTLLVSLDVRVTANMLILHVTVVFYVR